MSTEIAKVNPMKLSEMKEVAGVMATSGIFNKNWNTPEKIMTLMLLCQAEGSDPLSAVNRYDNIQGTIGKKPQAALCDFIRAGGKVEWLESTNLISTGKFTTPSDVEHVEEFTIEDAKRAKIYKTGGAWEKYPKAMLRARCISFALRAVYPAATNLMYSTDEVRDFKSGEREMKTVQSTSMFTENEQEPKIEQEVIEENTTEAQKVNAEIVSSAQEIINLLEMTHPQELKAFFKATNEDINKLKSTTIKRIEKYPDSFIKKVKEMDYNNE